MKIEVDHGYRGRGRGVLVRGNIALMAKSRGGAGSGSQAPPSGNIFKT